MNNIANRFCAHNYEIPLKTNIPGGWILKGPFITNANGQNGYIQFCNTPIDILNSFFTLCAKPTIANVPYFILQPRLRNRTVYLILLK